MRRDMSYQKTGKRRHAASPEYAGGDAAGRRRRARGRAPLQGMAVPCGIILRRNNVWRFGLLWLDTAFAGREATGLADADDAKAASSLCAALRALAGRRSPKRPRPTAGGTRQKEGS